MGIKTGIKTAIRVGLTGLAIVAVSELMKIKIEDKLLGQDTSVLHNVERVFYKGGSPSPKDGESNYGITFSDESEYQHTVFNASLSCRAKDGDTLISTTYLRNTIGNVIKYWFLNEYEKRQAHEVVYHQLHPVKTE